VIKSEDFESGQVTPNVDKARHENELAPSTIESVKDTKSQDSTDQWSFFGPREMASEILALSEKWQALPRNIRDAILLMAGVGDR